MRLGAGSSQHLRPLVRPNQRRRYGRVAYPLMMRGDLLRTPMVGDRPGEHYAADQRTLLFHVTHEIGAALFPLRA